MCCKGLLKRIAPFFITFALGLFVASFFVTLTLPNIPQGRGWKRHQDYHRRLEFENQRLREENLRLKTLRTESQDKVISGTLDTDEDGNVRFDGSINDLVPPPPPIPVRPARTLR